MSLGAFVLLWGVLCFCVVVGVVVCCCVPPWLVFVCMCLIGLLELIVFVIVDLLWVRVGFLFLISCFVDARCVVSCVFVLVVVLCFVSCFVLCVACFLFVCVGGCRR